MAFYRTNLYTGEEEWVDIPAEIKDDIEKGKAPEHGRYFSSNVWGRGMVSDALGIHPEQVKEFNEKAKAEGFTGIHFDKDGNCHIESRKERKRYCQFRGVYDRDAGYGDAAPRNF